jgi:threonylcarbamoyladenosine tRNA methylthiotransferase MtaB
VGFARLHVFPFSPREGTLAFSMPNQVPPEVKKERSLALRTLGDELRDAFVATQVNRRKKALLQSDGTALTSNYLRVRAKGEPGTFIDVVVDRKQWLER